MGDLPDVKQSTNAEANVRTFILSSCLNFFHSEIPWTICINLFSLSLVDLWVSLLSFVVTVIWKWQFQDKTAVMNRLYTTLGRNYSWRQEEEAASVKVMRKGGMGKLISMTLKRKSKRIVLKLLLWNRNFEAEHRNCRCQSHPIRPAPRWTLFLKASRCPVWRNCILSLEWVFWKKTSGILFFFF